MAATVVLVLFLSVVIGGMTLMLAAGYSSTENQRAQQEKKLRAEAARPAKTMVPVPGFFTPPRTAVLPGPFVFDDALVNRIENHVRMEQALVAQFVHHPSIDNLYARRGTPLQLH